LLDGSPMIYINGWFFLQENLHRKPWGFSYEIWWFP
jgi:hypothetical protein